METRTKAASFIGMAIGLGVALALVLTCISMEQPPSRLILPLAVCLVISLLTAWGIRDALRESDQTDHGLL